MKTCFALLFAFSLSAQNFVSFPDSGAIWTNSYYGLTFPDPFRRPIYNFAFSVKYCVDGADTLINNTTYTQVFRCDSGRIYFGALRDSAGLVSFVPKDSTWALKLYDFNVQVGDTLKDFYCIQYGNYNAASPHFQPLEYGWGEMVVQQVDTVYSHLGAHRMIYPGTSYPWLEGIGNLQGLFWDPQGNISNFAIFLECMSVHDSVYAARAWGPNYPALPGPCDLNFSVGEERTPGFKPYPNPSAGVLQLDNPEPISLKVHQLGGQQVLERKLAPYERLDLRHLAPGVYTLSIGNQRASWVKK